MALPPGLILSLDFELLWGVRDHVQRDSPYAANILGVREAAPAMLSLFARYEVAATWATVGLLFSRTRSEQRSHWPSLLPTYQEPALDPYQQEVGADESEDPWVFGADLLEQIRATPRQEIGTHTFSHFFCQEPGQTREQFAADLQAACSVARSQGIDLRSLVFPRHQVNEDYLPLLAEAGLTCYRSLEENWGNRPLKSRWWVPWQRGFRWLDTYVDLSGANSIAWERLRQGRPQPVPASRFLRPATGRAWLDRLQWRRLERGLEQAARHGRLFHVWWHPHNFGRHLAQNLAGLERLLQTYTRLRSECGMVSLTMEEAARLALA